MKLSRPVLSGITLAALSAVLIDIGQKAQQAGRFGTSLKWRLGGLAGLALALLALAVFILSWTPVFERIERVLAQGQDRLRRLGWLNLLVPLLLGALYLGLVYFPPTKLIADPSTFQGLWTRIGLVWLLGLAAAPFIRAALKAMSLAEAAASGALFISALHQAGTFFSQVSDSPFSLGWSEASRFFYGSLFQSAAVYGQSTPLPFLHPSRYMLLSLPFLLNGLPIWADRLWQVLLWLGLTGLTAWILVRRLRLSGSAAAWVGWAWSFLFIFQGPVYYHLLVCAIPVLGWFDRKRFLRSLAIVLAASIWAGISRINWYPMPAFLAVMIYLLETPLPRARDLPGYLVRPAAWATLGTSLAFGASRLYQAFSGQSDRSVFSSSFTSDLLWYRLWPSPTYPPGIFPMAMLLSAPLILLILINLRRAGLHPLRLLGLAGITLGTLAGGLVVSVKIGGGSNLHNLDAYFMLLLVWGGYLLANRAADDQGAFRAWAPWPLLALILAMPLVQILPAGGPVVYRDRAQDQAELSTIRSEVTKAAQNGGEVLFVWQRQLLSFHQIEGVRLIYEYETVDLMEMAMANNRAYLGHFYDDLAHHRFALIVTDPQNGWVKTAEDAFPEENNVYVERVTHPLAQSYRLRTSYPDGTQLWEPIP